MWNIIGTLISKVHFLENHEDRRGDSDAMSSDEITAGGD